jgi:hypothetical protein
MATKKNSRKKSTKAKKTARKKATPVKTAKRPKKLAKRSSPKKKAAKKKPVLKRTQKKKASVNKPTKQSLRLDAGAFSVGGRGSSSDVESGDLQGLSRREGADSESVDELLEEGNAFEADAVAGVESADDADEQEVHTHEVPEDDVPGEYLDED